MKTVTGQQAVVDMVANVIDIKKNFDATEDFGIQRLIVCTEYVIPYFNVSIYEFYFGIW